MNRFSTTFSLACLLLPGCIANFDPFDVGSTGGDCLTASELVEVDLQAAAAEAKSPSMTDATLDRWAVMPDSNADSMHFLVAACTDTRYTRWETAIVQAEVQGDSSIAVRYDAGFGRTYAPTPGGSPSMAAPDRTATFSIGAEGGDLELWLDSVAPGLAPTPRLELLTLEVTCSDESWEAEAGDEDFYDYGDDC